MEQKPKSSNHSYMGNGSVPSIMAGSVQGRGGVSEQRPMENEHLSKPGSVEWKTDLTLQTSGLLAEFSFCKLIFI